MDLSHRITVDPRILVGKPVVKGTRIAVEMVVDLCDPFRAGTTEPPISSCRTKPDAINQNSNSIPTEGNIGNMPMKFRFAAPGVVL